MHLLLPYLLLSVLMMKSKIKFKNNVASISRIFFNTHTSFGNSNRLMQRSDSLSYSILFVILSLKSSVADSDPGSGVFLTPVSWIRDPRWLKN
jgi:hypothetical protein